jgi:hypothetical protein
MSKKPALAKVEGSRHREAPFLQERSDIYATAPSSVQRLDRCV